ncbi:MAG: B12-binding domain-containing radical SAM protein [Candidatus Thorarchaeota archaeon]
MNGRILIVDALSTGTGKRQSSRDTIGCGPRAVAGVLERRGLECRIRRAEEVLSARSPFRGFDHLAISAMTMDLPSVRRIAGIWRRTRHSGRVLVGGPITADPSILPDTLADLFIVGEGEGTLDELIGSGYLDGGVDFSSVKGLAFMRSGRVETSGPRPLLTEQQISEEYTPSVSRIVDYRAYEASKVYVEVIRGCSNYQRTRLPLRDGKQCTECGNCDSADPELRMECPEQIPPGCGFCSVPSIWGPPRSRSVESIVQEVRDLVNLGVHRVVLEAPGFLDYHRGPWPVTDPCSPLANTEAIASLLQGLNSIPQIASGDVHLAIENIKACLFTEDVAQMLVDYSVSSSPNIGLETGSDEHLRQIGKCGSTADVTEAVRIASKFGMKPFVYFIYGLPGETDSTVDASIEMMRQLSADGVERIILYGFRPLPGSAFEGLPAPSPDDPHGQRLVREAERINRSKKSDYVGMLVEGIAAEPSWSRHGYTMVYPLTEGPLMTVAGGYTPGTRLFVRITSVLSSGLLLGEVELN